MGDDTKEAARRIEAKLVALELEIELILRSLGVAASDALTGLIADIKRDLAYLTEKG